MESNTHIPFNLLDIPAELAFIYSKLDGIFKLILNININKNILSIFLLIKYKIKDWKELHTDKNVSLSTTIDKINKLNLKYKLPPDINSFSFNKFIQIYIKVIL